MYVWYPRIDKILLRIFFFALSVYCMGVHLPHTQDNRTTEDGISPSRQPKRYKIASFSFKIIYLDLELPEMVFF